MTEENVGNDSSVPESTLPIKRRRGRPRKDESLSHGENSSGLPVSVGVKKSRQDKIDSTENPDCAFVGQMVSGILDGSFDAGYLLTVKVGNTDTVMRGVVFDPRLSVPISAENDVAPHVKMFKRSEIPLPIAAQPLSQAPPIAGRKEVSYELPANLHECNVTVLQPQESLKGIQSEMNHTYTQASQPSSSLPKDKNKTASTLPKGLPDGADQAVRTAPLAPLSKPGRRKSDHITKNGVILLPYYPVPSVVARTSQSEVKNQTPKTENLTPALAENRATIHSELPNGADVPEDAKLKTETEPSAEIPRGNEPGKGLPSVMEQPPGVQTHSFTPAIPDALLKVGPSAQSNCTLPPAASARPDCILPRTAPAQLDCILPPAASAQLGCMLPPAASSQLDCMLPPAVSAQLDCTLPPCTEPFQSVSQSLEMLLEKKVSPLGHLSLAGMQDAVMQPKAKILDGGHLSVSPSTGSVEVPVTDLHFRFMANHPYGVAEHEIPNPNPPPFTPKDTI